MKKLNAVLTGALLATASFATFTASSVDRSQAQSMQSIGNVSVSDVRGSLDDANRQLSQKAEEMSASHYRVIGVDNPGDPSLWTGTAEIYR